MMTFASSFSDASRVFTPADIIRWDAHAFGDDTRYERVTVDGRDAIHADCEPGAASGLVMREGIDLKETPVLEWEWRVDRTFAGLDESRKSGDDYAARLYAVDEHPFFPWRARSINYVWASEKAQGSHWANPYQSRAASSPLTLTTLDYTLKYSEASRPSMASLDSVMSSSRSLRLPVNHQE